MELIYFKLKKYKLKLFKIKFESFSKKILF